MLSMVKVNPKLFLTTQLGSIWGLVLRAPWSLWDVPIGMKARAGKPKAEGAAGHGASLSSSQ